MGGINSASHNSPAHHMRTDCDGSTAEDNLPGSFFHSDGCLAAAMTQAYKSLFQIKGNCPKLVLQRDVLLRNQA